jgi:excinuclease UvrABC ATPase subunit
MNYNEEKPANVPDPNCSECGGEGMADVAWSDDGDWCFYPCSECGGYPESLRIKLK